MYALTKGPSGSNFHAVDEDKILVKDIAAYIGTKLGVPTKSIPKEDSEKDLGFVGMVMSIDGVMNDVIYIECDSHDIKRGFRVDDVQIVQKICACHDPPEPP